MHSPDDVYADLEGDRRARESEIRLVERLIQTTSTAQEKEMLRRTIILLIYAHLEGFCKFALLAYAAALNALDLKCSEASYPIAAAGLSRVFAALRDPNSKHDFFRNSLPDDSQLHLAAREQNFVESYDEISKAILSIPDQAVDTKSNLSPIILKKLLFQLGLSYPAVDKHAGNIHKLLQIRNAISHGDRLRIPSEVEVTNCLSAAVEVMAYLQNEIFLALQNRLYLRPAKHLALGFVPIG